MGMKQQPHDQQQALNCPRCNSTNTKFCYYNNYSLSQPRHFCKACKRYWTRGGTLRSVPVGGGFRKNKKIKRPNSGSDLISTLPSIKSTGLHTSATTSSSLQSQFNAFKPALRSTSPYDVSTQIHSNIISFPGYGVSPSTSSSLISSSILDGFKESKDTNYYQASVPLGDLLMAGYSNHKDVKFEGGNDLMNNKLDMGVPCIQQYSSSLDSSVYWNSIGAWADLANYGSSVTSLI